MCAASQVIAAGAPGGMRVDIVSPAVAGSQARLGLLPPATVVTWGLQASQPPDIGPRARTLARFLCRWSLPRTRSGLGCWRVRPRSWLVSSLRLDGVGGSAILLATVRL